LHLLSLRKDIVVPSLFNDPSYHCCPSWNVIGWHSCLCQTCYQTALKVNCLLVVSAAKHLSLHSVHCNLVTACFDTWSWNEDVAILAQAAAPAQVGPGIFEVRCCYSIWMLSILWLCWQLSDVGNFILA
jgi:hypothetical protein